MTKRLVRVRLYDPKATGDAPASGVVECRPTLRRHIEGGDPDDFIVLPAKFTSRLGAALDYIDADDEEQTAEATDGVAWFWIDATDEGDYADLWAWTFTERTSGGMKRTIQIPTGSGIYEYGDADDLDADDFTPATPLTPAWSGPLSAEVERATDAEEALQAAIDDIEIVDASQGKAVTTDDSYSLPEPTGVGLEFIITAAGLDDIQMNGVSL